MSDTPTPLSAPFAWPVYCMCKPVADACNMRCSYCYYTDKKEVYGEGGETPPARRLMSEATLEEFTRQYIAAQTTPDVVFTWHGGEATLRPLEFYRKAVELQQRYGRGRNIVNCLQTNGLRLDDEWCRFLRDHHWLVGLSIDGPSDFHDEYRLDSHGRPTHARVMRAVRLLQRHRVEWNALAVVNDYNADYPGEFYQFFKNIGCHYLQFTPIVERRDAARQRGVEAVDTTDPRALITPESVTPRQWGEFLCGVFDRWVRHDVGQVFVQLFDATLANWVGQAPGICTLASTCGHASVIEYDGTVYSCDHFVFPQYRLGNIHRPGETLVEMMMSPRQQAFGRAKAEALPAQCRQCRWLFACHGECPKNRFLLTDQDEPGLNFLCQGYRMFFEHAAPYMDYMASQLRQGLPPANVMNHKF